MRSHRIGLVGCGYWGQLILRDLTELGCEVVVIEPSESNRKTALEKGALEVFSEVKEEHEVDAFIVASPASTHRKVCEALSAFRKPIFCEKPFVLNYEDAVFISEIPGIDLSVMHIWRYHPGIQYLKKIFEQETLGKVLMLSSRRCNWTSPRTDCDPVWTLLPHDVSIICEITGKVPHPIAAQSEKHGDHAAGLHALLEAPFPCHIEVSSRSISKIRDVTLNCERGVVVFSGDSNQMTVIEGDAHSTEPKVKEVQLPGESALKLELQRFLDSLDGPVCLVTNLQQAVEITHTLVTIREMADIR